MATRITPTMVQRSVLTSLNDVNEKLALTQRTMASGKAITRPSDDPFGASRALSLRSELEGIAQWRRNAQEAIAWQDVTDAALGTMTDVVQRARELLVSGASDSSGPQARLAIAAEIDQLIESLKTEASATYGGRFVFAGTATGTRPYLPGATDTPQANANAIAREIGPGVSVQVNVAASDLLGAGQLPAPGDGKLLDVLRDVAQHLRGGTPADADALRTTDLAGLDANLAELLRVRAGVGATTNRLEAADARLAELEQRAVELLAEREDADMARVLTDFSMQQAVYQSALRSGANIVQQSLLDFLR